MDSPSNKRPFSSLSSCSSSVRSRSISSSSSSSSFMEPKIEDLVDTEEKRAEALGVDVPRPLESLHATPIPPFLSKTYDLVDDPSLDRVISWGPAGNSFVLWEPIEFAQSILPRHFKHNNLSSFVRQLNTYGFHKVHADRWEFANEGFLRGNKPLLKNINRRRSSQVQQVGLQIGPSVEMVRSNLEGDLRILKGENSTMIQEVYRLQRENLKTIQQMNALNQRMQSAEQRQKQIVSFFAKVLQNPMFLAQLKLQKQQRVIASTRITKKFLKQRQPSQSLLRESSLQLTEEERLDSTVTAAMSGLPGDEYDESKLPDYLLLDTMEKLGIQSSRQELVGGSGFSGKEVGPLYLGSDASTCKEDLAVCRTHSSASSPRDIIPGEVFRDAVSPASVSASPDCETAAGFKGKNIINLKSDIESADSDYLVPFCEDESCEKLFIDAVETVCGDHEIWSAGLEGGESSLFSGHNTSQTVVHDFQELEFPAEPDALLNFNLDIIGEDLEFEKSIDDSFPFEEHEKNASLMKKDQNKIEL